MNTGICFVCGNRLVDRVGRPVEGTSRLLDGTRVRMHKCCSETFDREHAKNPAQHTTNHLGENMEEYEE